MSATAGPEERVGIWSLSIVGASVRKVRDDAWAPAISPDDRQIAFVSQDGIWVMGVQGENARQVVPAQPEHTIKHMEWAPPNRAAPRARRIAYLKHRAVSNEASIELRDLDTGQSAILISDPKLRDFTWAADGRVIYVLAEPPPNQKSTNLWEVATGPATGRLAGSARRITNWRNGYALSHLRASSDGKRIAFVRRYDQSDVYIGDFDRRDVQLRNVRRLTFEDRVDWPAGWSREGDAVLFYSDRNGKLDLYRQRVGDRSAEPLVLNAEEKRSPQLSPDGAWIVYLEWPTSEGPRDGRLMRVPVAGGPPEVIFTVRGYPGSAQISPPEPAVLTARGFPDFRCPAAAQAPCLVSEIEQDTVIFSSFRPEQAGKTVVARLPLPSTAATLSAYTRGSLNWDLSPDGSRIAVSQFEPRACPVRVLPVAAGQAPTTFEVKGWARCVAVAWSADAEGLFLASYSVRGSSLFYRTLAGEAPLLHRSTVFFERPVPSADGRRLAFAQINTDSNVWMIESQ